MRDVQVQKVYDAERAVFGREGTIDRGAFADAREMRKFARRVRGWKWWTSRFGDRVDIEVRYNPRGHRAYGWYRGCSPLGFWSDVRGFCVMTVPPQRLDKSTFAHELAHGLVARVFEGRVRGHGSEFAAVYLALLRRIMGKEAAAALTAEFKKRGVKHRSMRISQIIGKRVPAASVRTKAAAGATTSG